METEFLNISNRLRGVTQDDHKKKNASWHKVCFKKATLHLEKEKRVTNTDVNIILSQWKGRPKATKRER